MKIDDPDRAYSELRDLMNSRMSLDDAHEVKYFNDIEKGQIRARIDAFAEMDKFTKVDLEIYVTIDKQKMELDMQVKSKLETEYPADKPWQGTLWYYAYRSIFDKFLYGSVREGFEEGAEDKLDEVMQRTREVMETQHG